MIGNGQPISTPKIPALSTPKLDPNGRSFPTVFLDTQLHNSGISKTLIRPYGRTFIVTIQSVRFDLFPEKPGQHNGPKILKAILDFGRRKKLILNKTQCEEIADITGSEAFADWIGRRITLAPGQSHNHKPTIKITPPPAPKANDPPAAKAIKEGETIG